MYDTLENTPSRWCYWNVCLDRKTSTSAPTVCVSSKQPITTRLRATKMKQSKDRWSWCRWYRVKTTSSQSSLIKITSQHEEKSKQLKRSLPGAVEHDATTTIMVRVSKNEPATQVLSIERSFAKLNQDHVTKHKMLRKHWWYFFSHQASFRQMEPFQFAENKRPKSPKTSTKQDHSGVPLHAEGKALN